ncbi:adenine-specific DNA-methyltransferase [Azospirillum brasilense]|uniref:site-specific DNA-methyltransferase (adenine-specific) n=1 Tax=Azospirillum brasilense TaxID=192 RepID=A0A560AP27_AZOBR|nr:site-specific DNA-methyltransferase [Azospirillum brasilense]TWA62121.1 adenine-specific DNA-methyltransferase [Azospirillum brasilense]
MARNGKDVDSLVHKKATRKNIPTAEQQSFVEAEDAAPKAVTYPRDTPLEPGATRPRNPDLDPQLVWRGKDQQDWSDLVVAAPPIYIQEKIHPQAIIDDLRRRSEAARGEAAGAQFDFFNDFNGLPDEEAKLEFYQHDKHWANRMILGDSLQVMASLAEKEGLRGQVQCIYFDPPYGIKFNSNWQVSTRSRDVKDGKIDQISREPEQVKAFRDTWKDGIHSYMTYLRDRLTVARDLLTESGSIFVQIGDENVHRVRALMDEVFGDENCISQITVAKTTGSTELYIPNTCDYIVWYAKNKEALKYRPALIEKIAGGEGGGAYTFVQKDSGERKRVGQLDPQEAVGGRVFRLSDMTSQSMGRQKGEGAASWFGVEIQGRVIRPSERVRWKTNENGMRRIIRANRIEPGKNTLNYVRFLDDFPAMPVTNMWDDVGSSVGGDKIYVVQTSPRIIQRCIQMTTDPGDIVLDPTCGSGTTAYVAEQWGRRWITVDTSRVALALARARLMGAKYPYYHLTDSPDGLVKEAKASGTPPTQRATYGDIRQGFVYRRVPHITLKSIANNAEIDVIWDRWQAVLEPLRHDLNAALGRNQDWQEWEIPRRPADPWPEAAQTLHAAIRKRLVDGGAVAQPLKKLNGLLKRDYTAETLPEFPDDPWTDAKAIDLHGRWWQARIARQQEIDKSIADKADQEFLYDKPYEDTDRVRVAGPFTVESLSPHRVLPTEDEELWEELVAADAVEAGRPEPRRTIGPPRAPARKKAPHQWEETDFATVMLDHLKTSGVHQGDKKDRITFTSLTPWPGEYVAADARYMEGDRERRAAIFIGPEFGTVSRPDLTAAAREARDAGFELLIACAFNFDAHASELAKMGPLQIVRARMNPDLHMADDLKNTGSGNLFVVFGEPDIEIRKEEDGELRVRILGLDIFDPQKGEVRAGGTDDIAAWFIDTDYDEESFFVRHAYFLGAQDPYKSLKTTLKAEIDEEAWESLYRDTSRPFPRPSSGRIAVKVINHFGDEVMKVYRV